MESRAEQVSLLDLLVVLAENANCLCQGLFERGSGLLMRLAKETVSHLAKPLSRGDAGGTLASVGELQTRDLNEVPSITRGLQGLSRHVVVQPPTLPTEHVSQKISLVAALANQPGTANKLDRLQAAFKTK
jgi:hypothetical protein